MIMAITITITITIKITVTITITITIMIGKMMSQDCHRGKGKLSLAWVDVKKAYDYTLITSG